MKSAIAAITALLASVFILLVGSGLQSTLVPLAASVHGFDPIYVGLIGSSYFVGMALGCLASPWLIRRTGHIRAFAACTALATAAAIAHALIVEPMTWNVLRCVSGFCFAALYSVIESWLNDKSDNAVRGRVLAIYNVINYAGMAAGQQFLRLFPPGGFQLFSVSALLISVAAIPIALTRSVSPPVPETPRLYIRWLFRISPVGVAGALTVGFANGIFWALGPVYATLKGLDAVGAGTFITASIIGAVIALWPAGRISDHIDRRIVILGCCIVSALAGLGLALAPDNAAWTIYAFAFVFGAGAMPIYSLASAHTADFAAPEDMVLVATGLLLVYTIGAIVGPTSAALVMTYLPAGTIFVFTAIVHTALAGLTILRLRARLSVPAEDRERFVAVPRTSPTVVELNPLVDHDETNGGTDDTAPGGTPGGGTRADAV
jgi:MFS family permease